MENLRSRPYAWMPLSSRINVFILQIWPKKHLKKSPRKHLQENPHGLLLIPSKSWSSSCDDDGLKTRVIWWVFIPRNWSFHTPDSWKKFSVSDILCRVLVFWRSCVSEKNSPGLDVQRTHFWWLKHVYITALFVAYCIFPNETRLWFQTLFIFTHTTRA